MRERRPRVPVFPETHMFSLRKPTYQQLRDFLKSHRDVPFTYPEVEATRRDAADGEAPDGYSCGRQRVLLGHGREVFLQAKSNLREWKMFPAEFVELIWPAPIEVGRVVATLFQAPGFWTLNPCRIVYAIDDTEYGDANIERFGFAYGTVGSHLAAGEERFTVEHNHDDDSVWYEVYCFSKADHWLSNLAYPYLRLQQHRFRRLSARAMQREIGVSKERTQVAAA